MKRRSPPPGAPRDGKPLYIEVTLEERLAIERLADERGLSMRELVVGAVLGSEPPNLLDRILALESRMRELEHAVGSYLPVIRPVPDDVK